MSCIAPADRIAFEAAAEAWAPPPSPDPWEWACEHLTFGNKSPRPGRFDPRAFAYLERPLRCLNPEHPAREVTIRGSAQWGKTQTVIAAALATWFDRSPANALVVHPTSSAAADWIKDAWSNFRADNVRMQAVFGRWTDRDSLDFQETADRRGIMFVEASGSPSGLSGKTSPRVVMDDLSKFEPNPKGDPDTLAASRASAFEDGAKLLRASTPMIVGSCRITRHFLRGTAEVWHVPCPHCATFQPLAWENFEPTVDPADPSTAHFTCAACGCAIEERHRDAIVPLGRWVATNPNGDHPSFHMWRVYTPFRSWESVARDWLAAKGDAAAEQTVFNDVLGLPYEQASEAPKWEALRDRVENAAPDDQIQRGRIPARLPILTLGVDCQSSWTEWTLRAFGRDGRAHTVDHGTIGHPIGDDACWAELDSLLKRRWRNASGRDLAADRLMIDGGAYTEDVWSWARRHPWERVSIGKGASSSTGPIYALQKFERRTDGKMKKRQKRAFITNVSALKAKLYADLRKDDPEARGYQSFATGLGDAYYRGLCSERRILTRTQSGVMESRWKVIESGGRNEALDTAILADVAARLCGWASNTDAEWDRLEAARDATPPDATPDLFDRPVAPAAAAEGTAATPPPGARADLTERFRALAGD